MLSRQDRAKRTGLAGRRALMNRACLETLEPRLLLSVVVEQRGDMLFIVGDRGNDSVRVADLGGGVIGVTRLGVEGAKRGVVLPAEFKGIAQVHVDLGAGNDALQYATVAGDPRVPGTPPGGGAGEFADVFVQLGLGNDAAFMKLDGIKGEMQLKLDLGAGNDRLDLEAMGGADEVADFLKIKLDAGAGHDGVRASFFDVFVDVVGDLGEGNNEASWKLAGIKGDYKDAGRPESPDIKLDLTAGGGNDTVALLLPAVQKVRDAAARMRLGGGNDNVRVEAALPNVDLDIAAGEGNDSVLIGLLLPAVQKVRDAAARVDVNLGAGNDALQIEGRTSPTETASFNFAKIKVDAGAGNDSVRSTFTDVFTELAVDLGSGNDSAAVRAAYLKLGDIKGDVASDPRLVPSLDLTAGEGNDGVLIGLLLPAVQKVREAAARVNVDLGAGNDGLKIDARGAAARIEETGREFVKIKVDAGIGNDNVAATFFDVFAELAADLGDGKDSGFVKLDGIKGEVKGDFPAGADLKLDLRAGGGDDTVALLLPAVQKVREAAVKIDLGAGNDRAQIDGAALKLDLDLAAGEGNDAILIGLLLPAVQKVREAAARVEVGLGEGNDRLELKARSGDEAGTLKGLVAVKVDGGGGNDGVRAAFEDVFTELAADLGAGNDSASVRAGFLKIGDIKGDVSGEPLGQMDLMAGEGHDSVLIGLLLPAVQKVRDAAARVNVDLGAGNDAFTMEAEGEAHESPVIHYSKIKVSAGAGNDRVRTAFSDVFVDFAADLGAGDDAASVRAGFLKLGDIKGEVSEEPAANLDIVAGDGHDSVLIGLLLPAVQKVRDAAARVDLGAGNDRLLTNIVAGAGVGGGPHVKVFGAGGAGNDTLGASFTGVTLDLLLQGDEGEDTVMGDGSVLPNPNLRASTIFLDGGAGNDLLKLKLEGLAGLKAVVDGGADRDIAYVSEGVQVVNVEQVIRLKDEGDGDGPILLSRIASG